MVEGTHQQVRIVHITVPLTHSHPTNVLSSQGMLLSVGEALVSDTIDIVKLAGIAVSSTRAIRSVILFASTPLESIIPSPISKWKSFTVLEPAAAIQG